MRIEASEFMIKQIAFPPNSWWKAEPLAVRGKIYTLTAPVVTKRTCALFTLKDVFIPDDVSHGTTKAELLKH